MKEGSPEDEDGGKWMTNQEKKDKLEKYRDLDAQIESLLRDREKWFARATRMSPTLSGMPGGGGTSDKLVNAISKIYEIDSDIEAEMRKLTEMRKAILESLKSVSDLRLRDLLYRKYIRGETLEQIAVDYDCSWRHTCRLHGNALTALTI